MLIWVWRNLLSSLNLAPRLRKYTAINTTIKYTIKESIHPTNNTLSDALPHNVRLIAMLSSKVRTSTESRLSGQNAQDWLSPAGRPSGWSCSLSQLIQQSKWFIIQHIRFSDVRVSRGHRGRVSWMHFDVLPAQKTLSFLFKAPLINLREERSSLAADFEKKYCTSAQSLSWHF